MRLPWLVAWLRVGLPRPMCHRWHAGKPSFEFRLLLHMADGTWQRSVQLAKNMPSSRHRRRSVAINRASPYRSSPEAFTEGVIPTATGTRTAQGDTDQCLTRLRGQSGRKGLENPPKEVRRTNHGQKKERPGIRGPVFWL
jgi:hypothetical protein